MNFLTESEIKRSALRFLKTYYKTRRRVGESRASLDNTTDSGIIADGLISFSVDIGKTFVASFEATSFGTQNEVKYKTKSSELWMDGMCFGVVLTTIVFSVIYGMKWVVIGAEHVPFFLLCVLVSVVALSAIFRLVFSGLSHYRIIYAFEQFKLYEADEQWVALGEDVFENPEGKYMAELKRQCVINGFGLLVVGHDDDVRVVITPATKPLEGKARQQAVFTSLAENDAVISNNVRDYVESITLSNSWDKDKRFRDIPVTQLLIMFFCLPILFAIFWKEFHNVKVETINTKKYKNRTKEKIKDSSEETDFFIIDSGQVVNYEGQEAYDLNSHNIKMYDNEDLKKWYNESHQDSLFDVLNHTDDKVHILDSLKMEMEKEKNNSNNSPKIATTNSPEIKPKNNPKPKTKKPKGIDPFCKEYTSWYGTRYILQDGVYSSRSIAQKRIEQINKATALGGILKGGCFKQTRPYYTVYVDKVFTKKSDAEKALPFFNQLLKDKGYSSGELILVDITVKR